MSTPSAPHTTGATLGRDRLHALLGQPTAVTPEDVRAARERYAGLPMRKTEAARLGAAADLLPDGATFTVNICGLIVDHLVAELNVSGVQVPVPDEAPEELVAAAAAAETFVWDCWHHSELAAGTEGLFAAAAVDRQAFIVTDWATGDDGQARPSAYVNLAYDGEQGIEIPEGAVAEDGTLTTAIKHEIEYLKRDRATGLIVRVVDAIRGLFGASVERPAWQTVQRRWRTLYEYDRASGTTSISYWYTDEGRAEQQGDRWEVDESGRPVARDTVEVWPYGMPVIPFVSPQGGELRDLGGLQRLVQAMVLAMASAGMTDALRLIYTVDLKPLKEQDSGGVAWRPGVVGRFVASNTERGGQVGSINPASSVDQRETVKLLVEMMHMLGRSPYHGLSWFAQGAPPSGVAIKLVNGPFLAKVARYIERWSVPLAQLFITWQRMAGREMLVAALPRWRRLSYTTEGEQLDNAIKAQDLNWPVDLIGTRILDMSPSEIDQWQRAALRELQQRMELARQFAEQNAATDAADAVDDGEPDEEVA